MKHKHHINPRHNGGSDNQDNIKEVTISEHAKIHKQLYEQYGRWEDKVAWLGLSGQISKEQIIQEILVQAGHKGKFTLEEWHKFIKGKSYEEIYGVQKAKELKQIKRKKVLGKKQSNVREKTF